MVTRNNPAGRLAALLDRLGEQFNQQDTYLLDAWRGVFGAGSSDPLGPKVDEHEIARLLQLALAELNQIERQVAQRNLGQRYTPHIAQVRDLLSLRLLYSVAKQVGAAAMGTPREVLHTLADFLFESEASLTEEELTSASRAVAEMRKQLHEDALNNRVSTSVLSFFNNQLDVMDRAVRDYPIVGAGAFRNASLEAVIAVLTHPPVSPVSPDVRDTRNELEPAWLWWDRICAWWRAREAEAERKATRLVLIADLASHLIQGGTVALRVFEPPQMLPAASAVRQLSATPVAADATATSGLGSDSSEGVQPTSSQ
ncbi:MAG: hypothetical protein IPK33_22330 [Gemmatimonadetes bacterium]|nr:hypothetical protein [Gemmatimonadota bacterium]